MRDLAFVWQNVALACLACAGHGQRAIETEHMKGSSDDTHLSWQRPIPDLNSLQLRRSDSRTHNPLRALMLFLMTSKSTAGWQITGMGRRSDHAINRYIGQHPGRPCNVASIPTIRARRLAEVSMEQGINTDDPRVFTVELPQAMGIDWGCDNQFRWPYVSGFTEDSYARMSGEVEIGDQLVAMAGEPMIGLPITNVIDLIRDYTDEVIELVLFRGTTEEFQAACGVEGKPKTVWLTVQKDDEPDMVLELPYGCNVRDELVSRGINVYQSLTRWTNCNGKQRCGTCIIDVLEGFETSTSVKDMIESQTLRTNPETYKLSCITTLFGNATIRLFPVIGADQIVRR